VRSVQFERMTVAGDRGVCVVVAGRPGTTLICAHEVTVGQRAWLSRDTPTGYVNEVSRWLGVRLTQRPALRSDEPTVAP
jgi:hypothetical protein